MINRLLYFNRCTNSGRSTDSIYYILPSASAIADLYAKRHTFLLEQYATDILEGKDDTRILSLTAKEN